MEKAEEVRKGEERTGRETIYHLGVGILEIFEVFTQYLEGFRHTSE